MTTLLIDMETKTIYSDTRVTTTETENGKTSKYHTDGIVKAYKDTTGSIIGCSCGNFGLAFDVLRGYGLVLPESHEDLRGYGHYKNESADILIINKYINSVKHIHLKGGVIGVSTRKDTNFTANTVVSGGSGGDVAHKVYNATKDPIKAMRYAALCDKATSEQINILKLESL